MKNFTSILTIGALALVSGGAFAQADFSASPFKFNETHRTIPAAADFNNSGKMDIIYGGQLDRANDIPGWTWQIQTFLCTNQGNDAWDVDWYTYEEVEYVDEETGETKTRYDRVWANHGIIGSTFNQYGVLDYNNDGLLDILVLGKYEWDVFDMWQNITDDQRNGFLLLYKNLGDGKFELEENAVFPGMIADNEISCFAIAVGDYDRDGYTDFIVSATGYKSGEDNYPGRTVSLYRNMGGTGEFKDMKIAETKGGVWTNEVKDEETGEVIVEKKLLEGFFLPMSGNVHFADVNNDGWLDIVTDGWCDNIWDGVHNAGNISKIYLNQNGEKFVDVTCDAPTFYTLRSSASTIVDLDHDGYLDYFMTGWGDNNINWNAFLFYNTNDSETIYDEYIPSEQLNIDGTEKCRQLIRDFDGDGFLDIYYVGAAGCQIYYGNLTGSFNRGEGLPDNNSAVVADFNGNGLSDIFMAGYHYYPEEINGEGEQGNWAGWAELHYNVTDNAPEAPAAPENVTATYEGNTLTIDWDYDSDDAVSMGVAYNVYVKKTDGSVYTLVPADPATGFVKVGYGRTVALRPNITSYTLPFAEEDVEEVGVQAISLDNETYSPFTLASNGEIEDPNEDPNEDPDDTGVTAISTDSNAVYYNMQGIRVANPVEGQIYIVRSNGKTVKVVK